jgi:hypothetical protein
LEELAYAETFKGLIARFEEKPVESLHDMQIST